MSSPERFVTAEAVVLERDIAGLGSRFIGALVDLLVQSAAVLLSLPAAFEIGGDAEVVLPSVVAFLALFGYPTLAETLTRGRTVGKLAARTRVVRTDGGPVTFPVVLVRNLVRLVDLLPGFYSVGAVAILLSPRSQRLGDLAAGTVVLYEAPIEAPQPLEVPLTADVQHARRGMDVTGLMPQDYQVVRSFLARRHSLDPGARERVASELERRLRPRVGAPDSDSSPELFLEALIAESRGRPDR